MLTAPTPKAPSLVLARPWRTGALLLAVLLLGAACGCSGSAVAPSPSPTPGTVARPGLSAAGNVLLETWNTTLQALPDQPPLLALTWHDVRLGEVVEEDSVILTGHFAHVRLRLSEKDFLPAFVRLVKAGQVVGYIVAGHEISLEIPAGSLYPFRASPEVNPPGVRLRGLVTSVQEPAVISVEHAAIRKHYGALAARTEGPAPAATKAPARRSLGLTGRDVADLPPDTRARLSVLKNDGVFVDRVFPDTSASRARILPGDVILQFNGHPVHDSDDLMEAVRGAPAGQPVTVVIYRFSLASRLPVRIVLGGAASPTPAP